MSDEKRGRGRPAVYVGELRDNIAEVIRTVGKLGSARKLLNASGAVLAAVEKKLNVKRDTTKFPRPLGVSMVVLSQINQEYKIGLQRGRPKEKEKESAAA